MIGWLLPGALGGLALVALPIVVHLLRTHRAQRIPFPTLRFIAPSRTAAVTLRPPSDLQLLMVRIGIIAAAALAMAQPVLVTRSRVASWNSRLVRAVVVDSSAAMQVGDGGGTKPAELVKPLAESEIAGAAQAVRIDTSSLTDGVSRATAWLATAPPARREIVVLSTFRAGSLDASAIAQVPSDLGLRLVQVGQAEESRRLEGIAPLAAPGNHAATQEVQLTGAKTSVTRPTRTGESPGWRVAGLEVETPGVQRLWRTLAVAGTAAPSPDEPLVLAFGPDAAGQPVATLATEAPRWMLRTLARLKADGGFQRAAAATPEPSSL
ncbi:MAG: BatA domain-containing protein, partial [Vicinamibacterales bacterium]